MSIRLALWSTVARPAKVALRGDVTRHLNQLSDHLENATPLGAIGCITVAAAHVKVGESVSAKALLIELSRVRGRARCKTAALTWIEAHALHGP